MTYVWDRGVARQFRGCGTRHIFVGTIIATNVNSLNGGCGTVKSVAPGYASGWGNPISPTHLSINISILLKLNWCLFVCLSGFNHIMY